MWIFGRLTLISPVGKVMCQGVYSILRGCGFRSLYTLSADWGGCSPHPCWLLDLRHHSTAVCRLPRQQVLKVADPSKHVCFHLGVQVDEPFPVFSHLCFSRPRHSLQLLPMRSSIHVGVSSELLSWSHCFSVSWYVRPWCALQERSLCFTGSASPRIARWPSKPNALGLPPPDGRP